MESKVPFVACDNPVASQLTIHILAAVGEDEVKRISARTKAALSIYKTDKRISKSTRLKYSGDVPLDVVAATAGKLGASLPACRNLTPAAMAKGRRLATEKRKGIAAEKAREVLEQVDVVALRQSGMTLRAIADELNTRELVTGRGLPFTDVAVLRLLNRASVEPVKPIAKVARASKTQPNSARDGP